MDFEAYTPGSIGRPNMPRVWPMPCRPIMWQWLGMA